ncbi:MAG: glycosyltransferase family 4 protein [Acidimicrobiales bacterium]
MLVIGTEWFDDRPGGLARYLKDLVPALVDEGIDAGAIVLGPALTAGDRFEAVSRTDASLRERVLGVHRAACARAGRTDVVDAHFALYAAGPLLLGRLRKTPYIVHFHGPWAAESRAAGNSKLVAAAKREIERAVYRRASAVVVLSKAFGSILFDSYGVESSRIHVIAPGVDVEHFTPGDRLAARAALGFGPETFVAVCARRLERRMGVDVLLHAWRSVQASVPDSLLLVAGHGTERARLEELVAQLPQPAGVRILGRVEDDSLLALYQASDCSVVPTRWLEGFGLVVLESLACGTPPIVTDAGGLAEGVHDLDASLVVPAGDVSTLAARLVEAAGGALPTRSSCRVHAERFSWPDVARLHAELLHEVAGAAPSKGRRLRVAFVDHTAVLSGGELALARLLQALDVESHVILAEDGPLRQMVEEAGAEVHVLPLSDHVRRLPRHRLGGSVTRQVAQFASTVAYVFRLRRLLKRLRPDIVHTNSLKAAFYGGAAGRLARVPVVWHVRDRIADDYMPRSAIRLVRLATKVLPSAVIANSASTLDTLGRLSVPAVAIPSPVVIEVASEGRPAAVSGHPLRVGIVGRLAPWKGQDLFLRAFARAFPTGPNEAVIVGSALFGEDDFEAEIKNLATSLGLDGRVEFRGFRQDIGHELERIDLAVHASTVPEPFGQVVVEAMAAGAAVLVADRGGPNEIVDHEVTGLTYSMGDEAALSEAMERLAADTGLRHALGEAARQSAKRYRPEVVATEVLSLYRAVLGR